MLGAFDVHEGTAQVGVFEGLGSEASREDLFRDPRSFLGLIRAFLLYPVSSVSISSYFPDVPRSGSIGRGRKNAAGIH